MKNIKSFIKNWLFDEVSATRELKFQREVESEGIGADSLDLKIWNASGGIVIETRHFDRIKDRLNRNLHVITNEQDLGSAISKIITLETLRRKS